MAKKMINKTHIEGYLYESTLEEKIAGDNAANPGSKYISGKVSVQVDVDNIITVDIFESEYTKAKAKNKKYDTLKNLIESKTIVTDGENAARVRIDSALSVNDWYRPDGELITSLRNFNGFIHIITDNKFTPSATFEVDMLITSVTDSMTKMEDGTLEPDGSLVVNGYIFDFANRIMPAKLSVENANGVKYFRDLEPNTFTKVWGNMVTHTTTSTKVEESAFGDDKVIEYTNSKKKYVITGTNKDPYLFGEADILTVDEVKEAIAARNVALADAKARSEKANAASGAGTVTNAAAPSANSQFKF